MWQPLLSVNFDAWNNTKQFFNYLKHNSEDFNEKEFNALEYTQNAFVLFTRMIVADDDDSQKCFFCVMEFQW